MWTTLNGKPIELESFIRENVDKGYTIFIGTDSQRKRKGKRGVTFSTVIALVKQNEHKLIQKRMVTEKFPSLRDRLIHEAWLSLEVAQIISPLVSEDITIHLDVNQNPKFKSGQYKNEICGFVKGFGYNYKLKPESWCASAIADYQVR